jgi:hypothetical protein
MTLVFRPQKHRVPHALRRFHFLSVVNIKGGRIFITPVSKHKALMLIEGNLPVKWGIAINFGRFISGRLTTHKF